MTAAQNSTPAPITVDVADEYHQVPGGHLAAALDPETRTVYTYLDGTPFPVWHRRHMSLGSWPACTVGSSIQQWFEARAETIACIADGYLGDEWDGHNHIGRWTEDAVELASEIGIELEQASDELETYWDAGDYLCVDKEGAIREALTADTLEEWAEDEVAAALMQRAHIRAEDAVRWMRSILEDLEPDDDDYEEAQRLLGNRRTITLNGPLVMHVPPRCQGQTVEHAYGSGSANGDHAFLERVTDRCDGSVRWYLLDLDGDQIEAWDPVNKEPEYDERERVEVRVS